jgi:amidohydrolase
MTFSDHDIAEVTAFRRRLHTMPELSGEEAETAAEIVRFLGPTLPDAVVTGLGGHGVAAVFDSKRPGPTVMLRSELDGLPIQETSGVGHQSRTPGKGHLCGHDGHSATLILIARSLAHERPARGRIVLLFQPAEEIGAGARAVDADPRFAPIRPDISFSWHNKPGLPLGHAWLGAGVANCASRGLRIVLSGRTSHASEPENALSPMRAVADLLPALTGLSDSQAPGDSFAMVTVTHARLGEAAFGVTPGQAELWATLRTRTDGAMAALLGRAESLVRERAARDGLSLSLSQHDIFDHCENAPEAVAWLARAMEIEGMSHEPGALPFRGSEDFGVFGKTRPAAMAFIGAGETQPPLHAPDYDFPDALIPLAARVMLRAARLVLDNPR